MKFIYNNYVFNEKKFAKRLLFWRVRSGLTQEDVSLNLGISQVTLSNIESGKTNINVFTFIKFLNFFELDLDTFFAGDVDRNINRKNK